MGVPQIANVVEREDGKCSRHEQRAGRHDLRGAVADELAEKARNGRGNDLKKDNRYIQISALHQIHVFDRDRAAVAEIDDEYCKTDRRLRGGDGQNEQREYLADEVAQERRERDEVQINREQDQLDRHQDDDDVLAVQEDPEHADREENGADGEIRTEPDAHGIAPSPGLMSTISTAIAGVLAFCRRMLCRRTPGRCRKVRTIAPIMATRSTSPAI